MVNLYQILDVAIGSTPDSIRANFRRKAREYHPDKNPDNEYALEQFKKISQAYEVLSDPEKRHQYDTELQHFYASHSQTTYGYGQQSQGSSGLSGMEWWESLGRGVSRMASTVAQNWASDLASEVMGEHTYKTNHQSSIELAQELDYSLKRHRDGSVTFSLQLTPEDQEDILGVATRTPIDEISGDIAHEIGLLISQYFRRKWGR